MGLKLNQSTSTKQKEKRTGFMWFEVGFDQITLSPKPKFLKERFSFSSKKLVTSLYISSSYIFIKKSVKWLIDN
jgi:hypothetical protein